MRTKILILNILLPAVRTCATLMALGLIIAMGGAALMSCEELKSGNDEPTPEEQPAEQTREDSIRVASTLRYGDPDVIITDQNGNPIPGPNGGSLRASDIPTNPNIKFPVLDSIASMAKTLGLPTPERGQILYGISHGDNLAVLKLDKVFYHFDEGDKSMGNWGTLNAYNFIFKENLSDTKVREYRTGIGKWVDGRQAVFVSNYISYDNGKTFNRERDNTSIGGSISLVYIRANDKIEIYDYGSEKLIAYLTKGETPNTYKKTTINNNGTTTVEEIPAGFIFVEQPEDDPNSVL